MSSERELARRADADLAEYRMRKIEREELIGIVEDCSIHACAEQGLLDWDSLHDGARDHGRDWTRAVIVRFRELMNDRGVQLPPLPELEER